MKEVDGALSADNVNGYGRKQGCLCRKDSLFSCVNLSRPSEDLNQYRVKDIRTLDKFILLISEIPLPDVALELLISRLYAELIS